MGDSPRNGHNPCRLDQIHQYLQGIDLEKNKLPEVPEPIRKYRSLKELWLGHNDILALPDWRSLGGKILSCLLPCIVNLLIYSEFFCP
ncbi:MAG: hypothetical protein ACOC44_20545 [Promethearchaeia archaeon]